jgi:hypothetical protein
MAAPQAYIERCTPAGLIDGADIAAFGGAMIYQSGQDFRIERAWPERVRRAWTVRAPSDQE